MQKKNLGVKKDNLFFRKTAWGVMCYWKNMKVFIQVKLTLLEYSLFSRCTVSESLFLLLTCIQQSRGEGHVSYLGTFNIVNELKEL